MFHESRLVDLICKLFLRHHGRHGTDIGGVRGTDNDYDAALRIYQT